MESILEAIRTVYAKQSGGPWHVERQWPCPTPPEPSNSPAASPAGS